MHQDLLTLINATINEATLAPGGITWQRAAQAPAASQPYAVLTKTSGAYGFTHNGLSGLNTARVQVDCFAPTFAQADALREAIVGICGAQGVTGETDFRAIVPNAPRDFAPVNNIHRCLADLTVTWRAAPAS
jgi:hypothetical protein